VTVSATSDVYYHPHNVELNADPAALEPKIREYCARSLDPLIGSGRFDFVNNLGAQMPMRVIGMLLGIPETDQEAIRDRSNATMRIEAGKPMDLAQQGYDTGEIFAEYIDWRAQHPSDDIITELLNVEFEDVKGVRRRLTREELLLYVNVVAGAGNETTTRLIGWAAKVRAEHPGKRRDLVENPALITQAIKELLPFEPLPGVGSRPHHRQAVAHVDRSRLGINVCSDHVSSKEMR
jgi:cytochrome P450